MLINFKFKNYKSFRDEANLDLRAAPITESGFHVTEFGNEKILPLAAIYGPNASGKSNVIEAFKYMREYVLDSFAYGDRQAYRKKEMKVPQKPDFKGFAFDQAIPKEMEFEVWFVINHDSHQKTYNYGFVLDEEGVQEEWLNEKAKTSASYSKIFYREKNQIEFKKKVSPNLAKILQTIINRQTLAVSLGAKLRIGIFSKIRDWFFDTDVISFGDPIINMWLSRTVDPDFVEDPKVRQDYLNFISSFDESIVGFEVEELPGNSQNAEKDMIDIQTVHKTIDNQYVKLKLEDESDGTLKMLSLYPYIREAMQNGGVLFVDELNSRLHPLLVRLIMQRFADPNQNPRHAQLIYTTHDISQLEDTVLRRDEVWFTEKNDKGISSLYSLSDLESDGKKIRKDENYLKNYLLGKYGAIPSLKTLMVQLNQNPPVNGPEKVH